MGTARNYISALTLGHKIGLNDLENAGIFTFGNVYWVDPTNGSDTNDGLTSDTAFATISKANATVVSGNHDYVLLSANAAHEQTSMLTISKSRVHFVGLGGRGGSLGMGARARVTMGSTDTATDIAVMLNTGVGNTFSGIKFDSGNDKAESLYSVVESGEYAIYSNCEIYKSTDLDETTAAELVANGDSSQYIDCYIGSTADEIDGAIIRPCVLCTKNIAPSGQKQLRDNIFKGCTFARKGDNAANRFIAGANADDVERMLQFQGCTFFNNPLGSANPGAAIDFTTAQTDGAIFLDANCAVVAVTVMGTTGETIYSMAPDSATSYAASGLAVAS